MEDSKKHLQSLSPEKGASYESKSQMDYQLIKQKGEDLNRKKDLLCLILSYPINMVNKDRHEGWIRDVLQINRKVREMEKMLPKERKMTPVDTSKMYSEIITLLDHSMDDIEAYVPPEVINKMCKKSLAVDTTATIHTKETRSDSKVEQGKKGTIHRHSAVKQGEEASAHWTRCDKSYITIEESTTDKENV